MSGAAVPEGSGRAAGWLGCSFCEGASGSLRVRPRPAPWPRGLFGGRKATMGTAALRPKKEKGGEIKCARLFHPPRSWEMGENQRGEALKRPSVCEGIVREKGALRAGLTPGV